MKPLSPRARDLERRAHLFGQVRLVGELVDRALLEDLAIERAVDVLVVEEAEQLRRLGLGGCRGELRCRIDEGVAGLLELTDVVFAVLTLAARIGGGKKVRRTAAHDDFRPKPVVHAHDVIVVGASPRVRHHAGGCRILDLGVGHDADRHPQPSLGELGDRLDVGMPKRAAVQRAIGAEGVDASLVARGVGRHGVGTVGDDGIRSRRRHQRHVGHVVHGEFATILALRNALRQYARGGAVRHRHAVADKQDDVLGEAPVRRTVDIPGHGRARSAGACLDVDAAGLVEVGAAYPIGSVAQAVLVGGYVSRPAKHLTGLLAVDRHLDVRRRRCTRELDFQIEGRTGEYLRSVDRVDGLRASDGTQRAEREGSTNER